MTGAELATEWRVVMTQRTYSPFLGISSNRPAPVRHKNRESGRRRSGVPDISL